MTNTSEPGRVNIRRGRQTVFQTKTENALSLCRTRRR